MNSNNFYKAYVEVLEILKYVPDESVKKIPKEMLNMFELKKDRDYTYSIEPSIPFEEQKILPETKAILANIFRDYWATDHQREVITTYEKQELDRIEQKKRELYNPNDIFKSQNSKVDNTSNLPIDIKKEHFYNKLIAFIKKIFKL